MKKLLHILFIISVICSFSLSNSLIVVSYHLNKAYISKYLCENKANPNAHCEGKCYLQKQVKAAEKQEQTAVFSFKYLEIIFILPPKSTITNYLSEENWEKISTSLVFSPQKYINRLLRPPSFFA